MIKFELMGAADSVTGSRTLVSFQGKQWLVDCGLFQGPKEIRDRNRKEFSPAPGSIAGVILTHAHLDHSGYIPRLVKEGFRGKIHGSMGTVDLCRVLLLDAAKLEEEQASYANDKGYSNHSPAEPLFTIADAEACLGQFIGHRRHEWISIDRNLSVRFLHAGHIIGASMVQLMFTYGEASKILTFSGDLGHRRSLTIREPETLPETDVLVLESTYGNRLHTRENVFDLMESVARKTLSRGGILLIPAFAVGRAQEVLYMLGQLQSAGRLPEVPVILDSPMASSATEIYRRYPEDHREFPARLAQGSSQLPKRFEMAQSVDESMLACMGDDPKIIVSASGMLTGGRVLHHLKRLIGGEKNTVLFSGFQAEGTKGRFLQEAKQNGETKIRIHHREYPIEAEVVTIAAMSAHGDYQDHIEWLKAAPCLPKQVVINHGEKDAQTGLKEHLQAEFSFAITVASEQHAYNIA